MTPNIWTIAKHYGHDLFCERCRRTYRPQGVRLLSTDELDAARMTTNDRCSYCKRLFIHCADPLLVA